jgi:hypothetical protein
LLNDPRNRTAVRPIPAWPTPDERRLQSDSQFAMQPNSAYTSSQPSDLSVLAANASVSARRLDASRLTLKRFDSDSYQADIVPASVVDDAGWRSARR